MAKLISWQELYREAMLELDPASLRNRIGAARTAIGQAMDEPNVDRGVDDPRVEDRRVEDKQPMIEALRNLQTLERLELQHGAPRSDALLMAWTKE